MSPRLVLSKLASNCGCRSGLSSLLSSSYSSKSNPPTAGKKSGANTGGGSGTGASAPAAASLDKKLDPPTFVFKQVNTQDVGPGAGKDKEYKNPEYFSYHTMSYTDMDIVMEKLRCPQPSSVRK